MAAYCIAVAALVTWALRRPAWRGDATALFDGLGERERTLLLMSLCIFLGTFLAYVNWSYRLIFAIPALLVLSASPARLGRLLFWGLLAALWAMALPRGGTIFNFTCMALVPGALLAVLAPLLDRRSPARVETFARGGIGFD